MSPELVDRLTAQYVWAIQSDGVWYQKTRPTVDSGDFGKFRRTTGNYIHSIEIAQQEKLDSKSWAFVVLELWEQAGGDGKKALDSPGTLGFEFMELLDGKAGAAPSEEPKGAPLKPAFVRRKGEVFASCSDACSFSPKLHDRRGYAWSHSEIEHLRKEYQRGSSMEEIATSLRRTGLGICERMRVLGLIRKSAAGHYLCSIDVPAPAPKNADSNPCGEIAFTQEYEATFTQEKPMTTMIQTNPNVAIETRTIVFGRDAATLSDNELIDAIKRIEGDIAKLGEVKTESKKIKSNIKELKDQLSKIVEILDARA